jgi:hypothetical protein
MIVEAALVGRSRGNRHVVPAARGAAPNTPRIRLYA